MVTTAIGATGGFDRESLRLIATAVKSVNHAFTPSLLRIWPGIATST